MPQAKRLIANLPDSRHVQVVQADRVGLALLAPYRRRMCSDRSAMQSKLAEAYCGGHQEQC